MEEPITRANDATTTQETASPSPTADPTEAGVTPATRKPWLDAISLAEASLLADVGIIFDLAWIYVPILGSAFIPLIPAPFTILYLRRGARVTVFAAVVAGFLMTVLVGPHYGWRLSLEACIGLTLGWTMERRWRPTLAILLGLFVNATVAYLAAFGAVFVLGVPLHDLYLGLSNAAVAGAWLMSTPLQAIGAAGAWHAIEPIYAAIVSFSLRYWIGMFYVYILAVALPTVALYYSVAATTATALGYDVRPFPPRWFWRAFGLLGLALSPLFWLLRVALRLVTVPLWGPVWVARALAKRRATARLRAELARLDSAGAAPAGEAESLDAGQASQAATTPAPTTTAPEIDTIVPAAEPGASPVRMAEAVGASGAHHVWPAPLVAREASQAMED